MGFVDEDRLDELRPFTDDFAEDDGLLEKENLKLFELFLAELGATVELSVQQKFTLRCYFALRPQLAFIIIHFNRVNLISSHLI